MRSMLAGFTDYSHQSLKDIEIDFYDWIRYLNETMSAVDKSYEKIKEYDYMNKIPYDILSIHNYTYRFFQTCVEEITNILNEMKVEIKQNHIERIRVLAVKSIELNNELGVIWNSDANPGDYGNPAFMQLEDIYREARDMCADLMDLSNVTSRLENFIGTKTINHTEPNFEELLKATWVLESDVSCTQGTAFLVDSIGFVTCEHAVSEGLQAFHSSDITTKYPVRVLKSNDTLDLAIIDIEINKSEYVSLKLGDSDIVKQLDNVIVMGYPNYRYGDSGVINSGEISGFRPVSGIRRFLTNAPIISGNSGGPALNDKGEVIGVAVTGADRMENAQETEHYSIVPINSLKFL